MTVEVLRIVSSLKGALETRPACHHRRRRATPSGENLGSFFDVFWLVWDRVFPLARGLFVPSGGLLDRSNSGMSQAAQSATPPSPTPAAQEPCPGGHQGRLGASTGGIATDRTAGVIPADHPHHGTDPWPSRATDAGGSRWGCLAPWQGDRVEW